jgi:hypothetical protein
MHDQLGIVRCRLVSTGGGRAGLKYRELLDSLRRDSKRLIRFGLGSINRCGLAVRYLVTSDAIPTATGGRRPGRATNVLSQMRGGYA